MSVLIRNFVMPESCDNCSFCGCYVRDDGTEEAYRCCANMNIITDFDNRADWCPLVEIPPHGRLIAEDDTIETAWMILSGLGYHKDENPELDQAVRDVFSTAPAIEVE